MSTLQTLEQVQERKQQILQGDPARLEKQAKDGKLSARARIDKLLDPNSFVETGVLVAQNGRSAGVVCGTGTVDGRPVCVFAQDYTVHGGAMCALQAEKINKVLDMALKAGMPVVAMLDSAGARFDEGASALEAYAQVYMRIARLSGVVPMLAMVLGPCLGGGALISQLMDFTFVTRKTSQLMANGPQVVAATFEKAWTPEQIGGADKVIANGGAAFVADDEEQSFAQARKVLSFIPSNNLEDAPYELCDDLNRELSALEAGAAPQDIIATLADNADFCEIAPGYTSAIAGLAKIGGHAAMIVATAGQQLSAQAAAKLARAIRFADCYHLPVLSLVDIPGFAVVSPDEQVGLIRAASQLLYAYAEATTLKLSVVTGKAIGAAYVALCGKAHADVAYAWPGAVISTLSPEAAVQVLGKKDIDASKGNALEARAQLADAYAADVADGVNAAKAGLIDDVIDPKDTRKLLIVALEFFSAKRDVNPPKKHGNLPL